MNENEKIEINPTTDGPTYQGEVTFAVPRPPIVQIGRLGGYFLIINRPGTTELLVRIPFDGEPEYGGSYNPDEAARTFWSAMARTLPEFLRDPEEEGTFVPAPLLGPGSGAPDTTLIRKPTFRHPDTQRLCIETEPMRWEYMAPRECYHEHPNQKDDGE